MLGPPMSSRATILEIIVENLNIKVMIHNVKKVKIFIRQVIQQGYWPVIWDISVNPAEKKVQPHL